MLVLDLKKVSGQEIQFHSIVVWNMFISMQNCIIECPYLWHEPGKCAAVLSAVWRTTDTKFDWSGGEGDLVSNGGSICTTTNRGCISPKFGNPAVWSVQSHSLPLQCHKACIWLFCNHHLHLLQVLLRIYCIFLIAVTSVCTWQCVLL